MNLHGIEFEVKNIPSMDAGFIPFAAFKTAFEKSAAGKKRLAIAVERNDGLTSVCDTFIHGTPEFMDADRLYAERMVKFLLWMKGGFRVLVCGDEEIGRSIASEYRAGGKRAFDAETMGGVYSSPFDVVTLPYADRPAAREKGNKVDMGLKGCRIGFDAGGSDRKVSAVVDGEAVYSEEVVWYPKLNADPKYHYDGIVEAFKTAAAHMPRVDAIGVSSAGIYINNLCRIASLFIKVPKEEFEREVADIYVRAAGEIGDVPLLVCNDGDVAALAGALELGRDNVLGIALGTSEAGGFVDRQGCITGWLNELAFAPVEVGAAAALDEWSGDAGCGGKYLSQDGVIRLAENAGIALQEAASPAEKLKAVQTLMEAGDGRAAEVFGSLGMYLGHSIALYYSMYGMEHVMLMGRGLAGKGGEAALAQAAKVLREDYPEAGAAVRMHLPDEKARRVGQAFAAACLPKIG